MPQRDARLRRRGMLLALTAYLVCQVGMIAYVVSIDRKKDRLIEALLHHDFRSVQAQLRAGADPNTPISLARTHPLANLLSLSFLNSTLPLQTHPLIVAAYSGDDQSVQALLDYGADINAREGGNESTALLAAIRARHITTAEILLQRHADPSRKDLKLQDATIAAVQSGKPELLRLIYRYRAFHLTKDLNGMNAIDWAKYLQDRPMVTLAENYARQPERAIPAGSPQKKR